MSLQGRGACSHVELDTSVETGLTAIFLYIVCICISTGKRFFSLSPIQCCKISDNSCPFRRTKINLICRTTGARRQVHVEVLRAVRRRGWTGDVDLPLHGECHQHVGPRPHAGDVTYVDAGSGRRGASVMWVGKRSIPCLELSVRICVSIYRPVCFTCLTCRCIGPTVPRLEPGKRTTSLGVGVGRKGSGTGYSNFVGGSEKEKNKDKSSLLPSVPFLDREEKGLDSSSIFCGGDEKQGIFYFQNQRSYEYNTQHVGSVGCWKKNAHSHNNHHHIKSSHACAWGPSIIIIVL